VLAAALPSLPATLRRLTVLDQIADTAAGSNADLANNNSMSTSPKSPNANRALRRQGHEQTHLTTVSEDEYSETTVISPNTSPSNEHKTTSTTRSSRFIVSSSLEGGAFLDSASSLPSQSPMTSVPPLFLEDESNEDSNEKIFYKGRTNDDALNDRLYDNFSRRSIGLRAAAHVSPSSSNSSNNNFNGGHSPANTSRNRLHEEVVRLSSIEYNRRFLSPEEQEFLVNSRQDVIPQELLELLDRLVSLELYNDNDELDVS
jgi:hypothetical protein